MLLHIHNTIHTTFETGVRTKPVNKGVDILSTFVYRLSSDPVFCCCKRLVIMYFTMFKIAPYVDRLFWCSNLNPG